MSETTLGSARSRNREPTAREMGKDWNAELEKVNADMAKLTAELEAHGSAQTTSQTCKECVDI